MRILLSIHHRMRSGAGAPGATAALAGALRERGHDVDVIDFSLVPGGTESTLTALRYPHAVRAFLASPASQGYDVVDASSGDLAYRSTRHDQQSSTLYVTRSHGLEHLVVAARRRGAAAGELELRKRYALYHAGLRLREVAASLRRSSGVWCLSAAEVDLAVSLGVPRSSTTIGTNGLDLDRFPTIDRPVVSPPLVTILGDASWRKGTTISLAACALVAATHPDVAFAWLGAGSVDPSTIPEILRPRLTITATYQPDELSALLRSSSVAILGSRVEGMPISLLEAAACSVPVVATAIPGVTDLLAASGGGVTVPVNDPVALAHQVGALLDDPDRRLELGRAARRDVEGRTWAAVADASLEFYATLSATTRPR
jgi:glycosyltransferase involved in cell wall biosynthesis